MVIPRDQVRTQDGEEEEEEEKEEEDRSM